MPKKASKKKAVKKVSSERSGRPKNSGRFGCPTKAVRVPAHLEEEIVAFVLQKLKSAQKTK